MHCPSCGAQVPAQDLECTRCGANVGWWVKLHGGGQSGPHTFLDLQELIRQGRLGPLDRVRIGLIGEWVPVPEILSPAFQRSPRKADQAAAPQSKRGRRASGKAAIVIALATVAFSAAIVLVARNLRTEARASDPGQVCLGHAHQLARALRVYAQDSGGRLPSWRTWGSAAYPYVNSPEAYACPAAPGEPGYAYNAALSGVWLSSIANADKCAMLWDAGALGPSQGLSLTGMAPRHRGGDNYAFVDGHFSWRKRESYQRTDIELQPRQ